jgi:hypothetical protein
MSCCHHQRVEGEREVFWENGGSWQLISPNAKRCRNIHYYSHSLSSDLDNYSCIPSIFAVGRNNLHMIIDSKLIQDHDEMKCQQLNESFCSKSWLVNEVEITKIHRYVMMVSASVGSLSISIPWTF